MCIKHGGISWRDQQARLGVLPPGAQAEVKDEEEEDLLVAISERGKGLIAFKMVEVSFPELIAMQTRRVMRWGPTYF